MKYTCTHYTTINFLFFFKYWVLNTGFRKMKIFSLDRLNLSETNRHHIWRYESPCLYILAHEIHEGRCLSFWMNLFLPGNSLGTLGCNIVYTIKGKPYTAHTSVTSFCQTTPLSPPLHRCSAVAKTPSPFPEHFFWKVHRVSVFISVFIVFFIL